MSCIMQDDGMPSSLSTDAYAAYLERLSDTNFWSLAFEKAHTQFTNRPLVVEKSSEYSFECLTCGLRTSQCILPLTITREILLNAPYITALPAMPSWMAGVLSWRGETVAVIDLGAYLTKSDATDAAPLAKSVYLIVQHEETLLALCLLSVSAVSSIVDTQYIEPYVPTPQAEGSASPPGIVGFVRSNDSTGRQVLMLDMPVIFADIVQHIEGMSNNE